MDQRAAICREVELEELLAKPSERACVKRREDEEVERNDEKCIDLEAPE